MALTWKDLYAVDLKPLGDVVDQWKEIASKLSDLANEARTGMRRKSEAARWQGVNADVTRPFIRSVADEFEDARVEAGDFHQEIGNAYRSLKSIQGDLKAIVDAAHGKGIVIEDIGGGKVRCFDPPEPGHQDEVLSEERRKELTTIAEEVSGLVGRARARDAYTSDLLAVIHGNDPHNFAKNGQIDSWEARRGLKLARKGPGMSTKELREFNRFLKYNHNDPDFTQAFFKGMGGPKETLEFYARMSIDGTGSKGKVRLDAVQGLQRYLGPALANATDPDHKGYLNWGPEFRKIGAKEIQLDGFMYAPKGYQLLSGILRYGHYDKRFLLPIAEHVTQLQHDHPRGYWSRPSGPDQKFGFDPNGERTSGYDPVTGILEALGHSPAAAEDFFSKDPGNNPAYAYDEEGRQDRTKPLDYGYLSELTSDGYKWNNDAASPVQGERHMPGKDSLGHALEAAATGAPHDRPADERVPGHTPERAEIVKALMREVGENPGFATEDVSDSLGRIAGEYMPEINKAMVVGGDGRAGGIFQVEHATSFGKVDTVRFLDAVGRHPEGHAEATLGAQNYQTKVMHELVEHPERFDGTTRQNLLAAAHSTGSVEGVLGSARHESIVARGQQEEADFNAAVEKRGELAKEVLGFPLGALAERVPVAGDLVSGATDGIVDSVVESHRKNTLENDMADGAEVSFDTRTEAEKWAQRAARAAGVPPGVDETDFVRDVAQSTARGYEHGKSLRDDAFDNKTRRLDD